MLMNIVATRVNAMKRELMTMAFVFVDSVGANSEFIKTSFSFFKNNNIQSYSFKYKKYLSAYFDDFQETCMNNILTLLFIIGKNVFRDYVFVLYFIRGQQNECH
jgi:hypothetical protein